MSKTMQPSLIAIALAAILGGRPAIALAAPAFTLLYSFTGPNGNTPEAGLIIDANGNFYGTTIGGGNPACDFGCGTVFKIKMDGTGYRILHSFSVTDGDEPAANLFLDANGFLYGTTNIGSQTNECSDFGCGTVFKLKTDGTGFDTLHSFSSSLTDGRLPAGGLIQDASGELYGMTTFGGGDVSADCPSGCGTVFKLKKDGTGFSLIRSFVSAEGISPSGNLIFDSSGNLYGETGAGGANGIGMVFKIRTDGTGFTILHSFSPSEGYFPIGGLILDGSGILYGTTESSAAVSTGTIFKLKVDGTGFTVLHSFSGADGTFSEGPLILDGGGNLYGTTVTGGANFHGTVFTLKTDGTGFTLLHSFSTASNDGLVPFAGLILVGGNLYGTTSSGGASSACQGGCGTIFKLSPGATTAASRGDATGIAGLSPVRIGGR